MNEAQAERLKQRIESMSGLVVASGLQLSEKDCDVLGQILNSEIGIKALGILQAEADAAPKRLLTTNFEDPSERAFATQLQGFTNGIAFAISKLIELATENEEDSNVVPDTAPE
jgi:hypothetical protein